MQKISILWQQQINYLPWGTANGTQTFKKLKDLANNKLPTSVYKELKTLYNKELYMIRKR